MYYLQLYYPNTSVGLYASQGVWINTFGSINSCNMFSNLKLLYSDENDITNFDDWTT